MKTREEVCGEVAGKLAKADVGAIDVVIGFDGFVDEIIAVVEKRESVSKFTAMETIEVFGGKITAAAGKSANFELVTKAVLRGGNAPIMADAISAMGFATTFVGNIGHPEVHPAFGKLAGRVKKIYSIAPAARTSALEFTDGKIMLGNMEVLSGITWAALVEKIGMGELVKAFEGAALVGMVNWTMVPAMTEIWRGVLKDVLPKLSGGKKRRVFIDLADPEKRLKSDIVAALEVLKEVDKVVPVTLGLNLSEAIQVSDALGIEGDVAAEVGAMNLAVRIQRKLGIDTVVVHPRGGAAAANREGWADFAGPFVKEPKISTGAGDHFNAGFSAGQLLGMELKECLVMGTATSGFYVRNGWSASAKELAEFIRELPRPEGG